MVNEFRYTISYIQKIDNQRQYIILPSWMLIQVEYKDQVIGVHSTEC